MRLSLILEAKLNTQWLEKQFGVGNPSVSKIESCDPTGGWYYEWLTLLVKSIGNDEFLNEELNNNIAFWEQNKQVAKNLDLGVELASRNRLIKSLEQFGADIEKIKEHKAIKASSKRGSGVTYMSKEYPEATVVFDDGIYKLFMIEGTSREAVDSLERLGIGTEWCTRKGGSVGMAKQYLKLPQYVLYKNSMPLYQFSAVDFKDVEDKNAVPTIDEVRMLWNAVKDHGAIIAALYAYAVKTKRRWSEAEPYVLKDPKYAYYYARYVIKGPWPEAEPCVLKDPWYAYLYARSVIEKRWPEAEQYVSKDPGLAVQYARDVIKGPWPEIEPYVLKDPKLILEYAVNVIKKRWPEAEPYIVKNPEAAAWYAWTVMKGERWPEAEPYIMKDPQYAQFYAEKVMKGERWPEAEPYIIKDPMVAVFYAKDEMKGKRWLEAEPYIMQDPEAAYWYVFYILKRRWPEAEQYISKSPKWSRAYAARFKDFVRERQANAGRVGIPGQKSWALYSESRWPTTYRKIYLVD